MSLLQKAVETYDAHASLAGVVKNTVPIGTDGKAAKEAYQPLAPIGHTITSADIEITLDGDIVKHVEFVGGSLPSTWSSCGNGRSPNTPIPCSGPSFAMWRGGPCWRILPPAASKK